MSSGGELLVFGQVVDEEETIGPFAKLVCLSGRRVIEAHAYLGDEPMLEAIGRLDG